MMKMFFGIQPVRNFAGWFRFGASQAHYSRIRNVSKEALSSTEIDRLSQDDIAAKLICEKNYSEMSPQEQKIVDDYQSILLDQGCGMILPNTGLGEDQAWLKDLNEKEL